ncbi:MAG: helix-turn-helix transcriptional regulator [Ilumatobacteraceae bacterium]
MTNERLRARLQAVGTTSSRLAEKVEVDRKTVDRWISKGRLPHPLHRNKVAAELGVDETYLWPELLDHQRTRAVSTSELVQLYPCRGDVPADLWRAIVHNASRSIDLLVYAGLFWFDSYPDLVGAMRERAAAGGQVRLALGDAESAPVVERGEEEGTDIAARCRMTLGLIAPLLGQDGVEVRLHDTTLYTSIYRGDDVMLANAHTYGSPASHSPVLHLQRVDSGTLFEHYRQAFERVWALARPYEGS